MKYQDIQAMSIEELQSELNDARDSLHKRKLDHSIKGLENPLELRVNRKVIARLETEARKRQIADAGEEFQKGRTKIRQRRRRK